MPVETTLVPVLVRIVSVLGLLLACIGTVTIGLAIVQHRSRRRAAALRPGLRSALVERLSADEPAWDGWVERLSGRERAILLDLAEGLLRNVRGVEGAKLRRLVGELGVDERWLRTRIESGEPAAQHRALVWSRLLDHRLSPPYLLEHASRPRPIRLAAARTLYGTNEPAALDAALRLLVREGTEPLSLSGIDTLYRITNDRPEHLLDAARSDANGWSPTLLVQVLRVVRRCVSVVSPSSVVWIGELLDHESADVRTAAILALGEYAWHPDVRELFEFERLVDDPSASIRRATYLALDSCDGTRERELLADATRSEEDDRARLIAVRLLHRRNGDPFADRVEALVPATTRTLAWVVAESEVQSNDVRQAGTP
ncbi:HEAT repeat domain-containing protein [Halalkalicoccus ordinarius]|uniref:HEAT repeat domain-containing protein n=1 Tax=Halalkalicoccus ordinarius TaxID=3116651 RepID=UPI00300F7823